MSEEKSDAEVILERLRHIRETLPFPLVRVTPAEEPRPAVQCNDEDAIGIFEYEAVMDEIDAFGADLQATLDASHAKLIDDCLHVYFTGLDLVRDPANANLIPHLEAMRAGYEHDFGRPIPTREEWEGGKEPAS
jgi:hypothetical protein